MQGRNQSHNEPTSTATGDVLSSCVGDDWLRTKQPHQLWPEPWTGESLFEATDGIWRSVRHTNARRAFTTPTSIAKLKLPLGVKWTGSRCTVINPVTRAQARGLQPSAIPIQAPATEVVLEPARNTSADQAMVFHSVGWPAEPVSPHTGGGGVRF